MHLKAKQEFTYFLRGVEPVTFAKGDEFETDDQELAEVAQREGWAAAVAVDQEIQQKPVRRKAKE
ncbi:MAG: hypothetical protein ABFC67_03720 [Mizugakiibacter sp.]|uniref:hypothetical protein n=1 Tax=Mizugakiibacter sp. TaxID=1972610 RepID=UPI00320C1ABD